MSCDSADGSMLCEPWYQPRKHDMTPTSTMLGAMPRYETAASGLPWIKAMRLRRSASAAATSVVTDETAASVTYSVRRACRASPVALYPAVTFATAAGRPPLVAVSSTVYSGNTIWYRPIPSAPMTLVSGMRYSAPMSLAIMLMTANMPAPVRNFPMRRFTRLVCATLFCFLVEIGAYAMRTACALDLFRFPRI